MTDSGKFGKRSSGRRVRQIDSNDPVATARKLFNLLSRGGTPATHNKVGQERVYFPGGTHVSLRQQSSSGSPAIDIKPGNGVAGKLARQKIHFERNQ